MESTLKGENLLLKYKFPLLRVDTIEKGTKMKLLPQKVSLFTLTLLHSERPKLHTILDFLSGIGLIDVHADLCLCCLLSPYTFTFFHLAHLLFYRNKCYISEELQIRGGIKDNSKIIFLISQ